MANGDAPTTTPPLETENSPITGQIEAPPIQDPGIGIHPAVLAEIKRQQQGAQPPQQGGKPLLLDYIQSMIKGPQQASPLSAPTSRGDMTLNFMGQFLSNMAQGLQQAGHGPGANLRGAAGAIQAPYQRALQEYQLGQQQQAQQAQIQSEQAKTQLTQAQAEQYKNVVMTPLGPMNQKLAERVYPAELRKQGQENVADTRAASAKEVAEAQIAGKADIAAKSLAEKQAEFKSTDTYRTWKAKLDAETKIRVADLTANKAPAAMLQTAAYSQGGLQMMNDANAAMQRLEAKGALGSNAFQNKVETWVFGKGLVDPSLDAQTRKDIGLLRAALGYTSSAAMRAHTGRSSKEIYDDFKARLGPGQDWSALRGAMDETSVLLTHYSDAASNAAIKATRSGSATPAPTGAKQYSPDNPWVKKP